MQRINEAVRRIGLAVSDAVAELSRLSGAALGAPPPQPDTPAGRYTRLFGPLTTAPADATRKINVLRNFRSLATKLLGARGTVMSGLRVIDARNDAGKRDCSGPRSVEAP
jgi:hypothetical protein